MENKKTYFFVDESGDPIFYNRHGKLIVGEDGCSRILILGFVKTENPEKVRVAIRQLQKEIERDNYLKSIPSVQRSIVSFHATDDCPEVRERVFKSIVDLPFKVEIFVARKIENIFLKRHKGDENLFYDDLITKLFKNQLHKSSENIIYFSKRGNRVRQVPLANAIQASVNLFEDQWKTKINSQIVIYSQRPEGEPCLQVIDYINWAVQRIFIKKEKRYFDYVRDKISLIVDVYDSDKYPNNYYNKTNALGVEKISPL